MNAATIIWNGIWLVVMSASLVVLAWAMVRLWRMR